MKRDVNFEGLRGSPPQATRCAYADWLDVIDSEVRTLKRAETNCRVGTQCVYMYLEICLRRDFELKIVVDISCILMQILHNVDISGI
jgi:hypothetical protein